jgi:hypothetical protein
MTGIFVSSHKPSSSGNGKLNFHQHGKHIFNGLAHFIKGSVFLLYGFFTFARWMGCFGHLGWAWNLKPSNRRNWKSSITMEGIEGFLILLYGVSNVFLEHLSAWGEVWSPQDFEHVAISLLFIGGGLVSPF